jgi:hypothetical protein
MRNSARLPNSDFEFRISNFGFFPAHPRCDLRGKGAINGGAWLPIRHGLH